MAERHVDQADGLRRMFAVDRLRVVHVVAGRAGVGRTTVTAGLGAALARAGREVMLLAGGADAPRTLSCLGLDAARRAGPDDTTRRLVSGPHGLAVLPFDAAMCERPARATGLALELRRLCAGMDFLLINGRAALDARWLLVEPERHAVVVVASRAAASITGAYGVIKRLSTTQPLRRFHVLLNRVGTQAEAQAIFRNMAAVASGYLDVRLDLLGFIPHDVALECDAPAMRVALDARPGAPAAIAIRRLAEIIGAWPMPAPATQQRTIPAPWVAPSPGACAAERVQCW